MATTADDPEVVAFVSSHPDLRSLIESFIDDDDCSFDIHGGCQTHGYFGLQPDEMCPNEEAKRLISACG